ncbi:MAG: hypothetical protein H7Z41_20180, partial [Cytophagales bacterium]|nr:hypothetical protein [Armatimonadota bacterium]
MPTVSTTPTVLTTPVVTSPDRYLPYEYRLLRTGGSVESLAETLYSLLSPSLSGVSKVPGHEPLNVESQALCGALAQRLMAQQHALTEADTRLNERHDDAIVRLLQEEAEAFAVAASAVGRAQREGYKDALHLVQGVTKTPSGRRHCGAWFRQGWLLWNTEAPLTEVEEAFYQAARLAAAIPAEEVYRDLAVRHLAEIQIALGQHDNARETMAAALTLAPQDPLTLRAAARAAALA